MTMKENSIKEGSTRLELYIRFSLQSQNSDLPGFEDIGNLFCFRNFFFTILFLKLIE